MYAYNEYLNEIARDMHICICKPYITTSLGNINIKYKHNRRVSSSRLVATSRGKGKHTNKKNHES